jgi:hypothetical protein
MSPRDFLSVGLVALGSLTAASPWLLGFRGEESAALSACAVAALLLAAALAALVEHRFASVGAMTIGAWSLAAPLLFGFAATGAAFAAHVVAGTAAMLLAAISLDWRSQGPPEIPV